jgi:DNA-binding MarR family transcriptional regulator
MFEMGRLLKRDFERGQTSMLHVETLRYIDQRKRATATELSRYLHASKPTVSALVDSLFNEGLVERRADKGDRRKTLLSLSAQGRRVLLQAGKRRERAIERLFAPLPRRDRQDLTRILSFIINRAS